MSAAPDTLASMSPDFDLDAYLRKRAGRMRAPAVANQPGAADFGSPGFSVDDASNGYNSGPGQFRVPESAGPASLGTAQPASSGKMRMPGPGTQMAMASPAPPPTGGAPAPAPNAGIAPSPPASTPNRPAPGQDVAAQMQALQRRQAVLSTPQGNPVEGQPGETGKLPVLQSKGVGGVLQRVAMGLLSATKLAPYAQQIVHPVWSQESAANAAELAGIQSQVGTLEKGAQAEEAQQRGQYYVGLDQARVQAAQERASGTKEAAATRAKEEDVKRRQTAFDTVVKGQNPLYVQEGQVVPTGWVPVGVPNPSLPEGWTPYLPSPVATLPQELQKFMPQYKVGDQIPRAELNSALAKYQSELEQVAIKGATNQRVPVEQQYVDEYIQLHPGATVAEALAHKPQPPEKPKEVSPQIGVLPGGDVIEVKPGMKLPQGATTFTQSGSLSVPTATTRGAADQGSIIVRAGDDLIKQIEENRGAIGNIGSYWDQFVNQTPIADPTASYLMSQLSSFAALQPRLHGFRSHEALKEFSKIIGGIPKNPDALIASIRGIQNTARIVAEQGRSVPVQPSSGGPPPRPAAGGGDMVQVQMPNGGPVGPVHRTQLQRFLRDHPGAQEVKNANPNPGR